MDLAAVMLEVAARLRGIDGLRVHDNPGATRTPPAAIVLYPETLTFDGTYRRGMDRMSLPLSVVVGKVSDRSARNQLAAYCNGNGARSIKQTLESGAYTEFDELRVESIDFDYVTYEGALLVEAMFTLDIVGSGT